MGVEDHDEFWRALRDAVDANDDVSAHELQSAEEVLRQIESDMAASDGGGTAEQCDQAQIDRWVEGATGSKATAPPLRLEPTSQHTPKAARPWQAWIAAAAAFVITPKFLVAATLVAGVAVTGALLQRTTTTLPFEVAVGILLDTEQPASSREAAGGRVYFDVVESIQILSQLATANAAIASPASDAISQLRQELRTPTAFVSQHFTEPLSELTGMLLAADVEFAAQEQSLDSLLEQARYGLRALQEIALRNETGPVGANNTLHLQRIASLLKE